MLDLEKSFDLDKEWRGMLRRLVAQLDNKQLPDLSDSVLELDSEVYTSSERFARERTEVFRRQPLLAGFSGELVNVGDRLCFDAAGVPVLLLRGEDGVLRAFLNICTHRASKLVADDDDSSCHLVCPFHGWSYNLDGSLKGQPLSEAFAGLDKTAKGLVRLPVAEWEGMVFVIATPGDEDIDVKAYLGDMAPLLAALKLGELKKNAQDHLAVKANWKLVLDTGREIYHVPVVHRNTLAKNLYSHTMIVDNFGLHNRYSGASKELAKLKNKSESEWPESCYQGVHYIYPNTNLSISRAVDGQTPMVSLSRTFPGSSVGESYTYLSTYSRDGDQQSTDIHQMVVKIVDTEDYVQAEQIWKNIEHQPKGFKLALGRNEALLQRYHLAIAEQIAMPLNL